MDYIKYRHPPIVLLPSTQYIIVTLYNKHPRQHMTRVLMVDDSAPLRKRLAARLVNLGTVEIVGEASDVQQAIKAFRALEPDVIVLDIQIPGGSGFDVLKVVKKERPETVVVMLTNYPCAPFRWRSKLMGAEYLFDKTSEFEKVADVLKTAYQEEMNG